MSIDYVVYAFAVYAITFALRDGKVPWLTKPLERVKFFRKMLECVYCTGTEVGWLLASAILVRPAPFSQWGELALHIGLLGLAAGAFCMLIESVLELQDGLLSHVFGKDGSEPYPGPEAAQDTERK